jgi:aminopeptidase YwaD
LTLRSALLVAVALVCGSAIAQQPALSTSSSTSSSPGWTVRTEWVRAHEDFLASDALAGRGSATRDEEIAATYVASRFEGYGLQRAPGMSSYIQAAGVEAIELDGKATLGAGSVVLAEGADFDLLLSPGTSASGPLVRIAVADVKTAQIAAGSAVLLTGVTDPGAAFQAFRQVNQSKPALILVAGTPALNSLYGMMGGKTRTPIRLAGDTGPARNGNVVLVRAADKLPADGTTVSLAVHAMPPAPRQTFNALGYLPGTDPKAGTILLSAHLDHLGISRPVNGDGIYNGANDDAAGTTAVLELAHALAAGPRPRRSILFVCYGSEELGLLGSRYFGEHLPIPIAELVTNVEFEMIGNQDPKMPKGVLLLTGWERSNLGPTLKERGALIGPDPYPEQHFFERSDNYSLALQGVVAHTAAGWGTPPTYHQPDDDLAHIDIDFMTAAIQSLVEPVRWLASSDFRPAWNPGGAPQRGK